MYLKMTQLCCFDQDNTPFLTVPRVVFVSSLLVALKRTGFGDETRMQTWK